nr:hypothetical protein GCM10020092_052330 [Actinoplanes digitatis]
MTAYVGDSAFRMAGLPAMPVMPQAPMARNQAIITGPNSLPTAAVPRRWKANSTTMIIAVAGTIRSSRPGWTTLTPSTADNTEMAGVIMLSPKNSAAPKTPAAARIPAPRRPPVPPQRRSMAISAMMPPSPSLFTRITSVT